MQLVTGWPVVSFWSTLGGDAKVPRFGTHRTPGTLRSRALYYTFKFHCLSLDGPASD